MQATNVVSVTDLRNKTTQIIKSLRKWPKYIFANNKPVARLSPVNFYEAETEDYDPAKVQILLDADKEPDAHEKRYATVEAFMKDLDN